MNTITFDQLPEAVQGLQAQLTRIEQMLSDQPTPPKKPKLRTVKETARYLDLSDASIYRHISNRTIPHIKRGKRVYFREEDLDAWLASGKRLTTAELAEQV